MTSQEKLNKLLKVYKEARQKIAIWLLEYDWTKTAERILLSQVNEIIKSLSEQTNTFYEEVIPIEYDLWLKEAKKTLKSLKVDWLWSLTVIDKKSIENLLFTAKTSALIGVEWIKKWVAWHIRQIKQNKIRELLAVWRIVWEWVQETSREASNIIKKEWIYAFTSRNGSRLKLEEYMNALVKNTLAQANNDASYNRYTEAWITVVQYSTIWDNRVSAICAPREWKYYELAWITTLPSWSHYNCRHILKPVVIIPEGVKIYKEYQN